MATYLIRKIGVFRSTTKSGFPTKTYVYYGKEENSIAIRRYILGTDISGWKLVKEFKDKGLYITQLRLRRQLGI